MRLWTRLYGIRITSHRVATVVMCSLERAAAISVMEMKLVSFGIFSPEHE